MREQRPVIALWSGADRQEPAETHPCAISARCHLCEGLAGLSPVGKVSEAKR
jgi:hypothetical protein